MKIRLILLTLLFFSCAILAQQFESPESVEFDEKNNRYLVSNKANSSGNSSILQIDMNGENITTFALLDTVKTAALEIVGDTLFAASDYPSVMGFSLSTGQHLFNWQLDAATSGAEKFNGLAHDPHGNLYVSEPKKFYVYKLDLSDGSYKRIDSETKINGLHYDVKNDRLLVCGWNNPAKIQALNYGESTLTTVYTGDKNKFQDIDGLTIDNCGNIYTSSWSLNKIILFRDGVFANPVDYLPNLNGPADIGYNSRDNVLMIPNLKGNNVMLHIIDDECDNTARMQSRK